jgi:hypothetical protein
LLHVRDEEVFAEDVEGVELSDLHAARAAAVAAAREMLAEMILHGRVLNDQRIEVHDQSGMLLLVVRFEDVINRGQG